MEIGIAASLVTKLHLLLKQEQSNVNIVKGVHSILLVYLDEVLDQEEIHFTTLFTKLAYLSLKHTLSRKTTYFLHKHRIRYEGLGGSNTLSIAANESAYALIQLLRETNVGDIPKELERLIDIPKYQPFQSSEELRFRRFARVHIFRFDPEASCVFGFDEEEPETEVKIQLNVIGKNDDYNSLLKFLSRRNRFPIILNLEDIEIERNGVLIPRIIVFEPDYLMDVTTVSECFKADESNPIFYFIKKFIPVYQNKYLIVGNVANYFLDELFYNPEISFTSLIKDTFRISPLGFSMMSDNELKEVVSTLKTHYHTIKQVIEKQLPIHNVSTENVYLEPSFYAPQYGFQGRLDLFSSSIDQSEAKIIELKSGKPYRSNSYGLNINHYVQTLLYDLMIQAVSKKSKKISSFILYSSQSKDALRFAPPLKVQQKEAIKLRNQLVEIDYLLADVDIDNEHLFSFIDAAYIKSSGFAKRDIERFQKCYKESSSLVRMYFNAYTAFVAREQILAKTGEFGQEKSRGLAGLWLDEMHEKIENYLVLNALNIRELKSEENHTIITFTRSEETEVNANFRKGDLGVLYPFNSGNDSVLRNQVFKCSIIAIDQFTVQVRLRNRQQNTNLFITEDTWHIEHDHLDHGFNAMYQDLFFFLSTSAAYQELVLGLSPPRKGGLPEPVESDFMTSEQKGILSQMISAQDYFLLWGPPGTGKTSVMLYEYIKHAYLNTDETILVLAYTNRAVDEICEAITRIGNGIAEEYFRIGSRYSSNEKFVDDLLVKKLEDIDNRFELLELLGRSRIIVSTLASIHGKKELFSLLKFDTFIVDEASQILEPQLIGFLSRAKKFILIGDHYQLPAIVRQREDESQVMLKELKERGIEERRNSLFERLYRTSLKNSWTWSLGRLSQQGRMHEDIMEFANEHFYNGQLSVIEGKSELVEPSEEERIVYIPSKVDLSSSTFKTNKYEAEIVLNLFQQIKKDYSEKGQSIKEDSIGVITPYRAQISAIRSGFEKHDIADHITVDTVERYQGTARDIIIISFCLNSISQLKKLISMSSDGVDRKLNVALTRARKRLYIIGNEEIMTSNQVYKKLIDRARTGLSNKTDGPAN